jgi:hypothetical protein
LEDSKYLVEGLAKFDVAERIMVVIEEMVVVVVTEFEADGMAAVLRDGNIKVGANSTLWLPALLIVEAVEPFVMFDDS